MSTSEINMTARAFPLDEPKGNLLGSASVTINGGFAVNGIKVVQGEHGPFVAMPSSKGSDGKYRDICFPTTKEGREQLNAVSPALSCVSRSRGPTNLRTSLPGRTGP